MGPLVGIEPPSLFTRQVPSQMASKGVVRTTGVVTELAQAARKCPWCTRTLGLEAQDAAVTPNPLGVIEES